MELLKYLALGSGTTVKVYSPRNGKAKGVVPHIGLNYAATKPLLVPVQDAAVSLETWYRENIGRGAGPNAEIMTMALEEAREAIGEFFGYNPAEHVVIFVQNTSQGMSVLTRVAARDPQSFFLISPAAHHSTMLPARETDHYDYFRLKPDGTYDLNDLEIKLKSYSRNHHPVLCVESSSNVTGYKNQITEIANIAARYNTLVFIDHAQGATSMQLDLSVLPGRVFLAVSGHKMYARDGSGAIVGPKDFFEGPSLIPAGGTITGVTLQDIFYAGPPYNFEPGTPAYIAQVSLGKAALTLARAGMVEIEKEEERLTRLVMANILNVPGLRVLGEANLDVVPRGPVISFSLKDDGGRNIPPGFVLKALEVFYGVDSRPGQFCAHPYLYTLLRASQMEALEHAMKHARKGRAGCAALPGDQDYHAARISFGFPTKDESLLDLPHMLTEVRAMWPDRSALKLDPEKGEFYLPGQDRILTRGTFSIHRTGRYTSE
ncbi:MAG: aminotransferase class V-fold PLP-dependent enzyme [Candidatus Margulisbacteria bacterium]|nr:aminotransferase class V-fold PLP-dependent enzyme [Candidatus Margulisiibacteriota bacterium]